MMRTKWRIKRLVFFFRKVNRFWPYRCSSGCVGSTLGWIGIFFYCKMTSCHTVQHTFATSCVTFSKQPACPKRFPPKAQDEAGGLLFLCFYCCSISHTIATPMQANLILKCAFSYTSVNNQSMCLTIELKPNETCVFGTVFNRILINIRYFVLFVHIKVTTSLTYPL